jgi:hypothetical protein
MNAAQIKRYGLARVAQVQIIANRKLKIDITDPEAAKLTECIYAFITRDRVVRIGSSKAPLEERLKDYRRDITNALKREKSPAPPEEAKKWRKLFPTGSSGFIYARQGTMVKTPICKFRAYLDEESILIRKLFDDTPHDQILNRNKHR